MAKYVTVLSEIPNLLKELQKALPTLQFTNVKSKDINEIKKAEIIVADYDLIGPYLYDLPNLKWIQGTWAGIDSLLPHILPNNPPIMYPISRFSGKHLGNLMAEYVVSNIILHERHFFQIKENQKTEKWSKSGKISNHRSISELTIGVLGIGHIGGTIAKTLDFLGAQIYGFGRKSHIDLESQEYKHLKKYYTNSTLPELLQNVDYIVNVLPSTPETQGLLNGNVLENCKEKEAILINVGRGSIVSEKYLLNALGQKWLSAAILDVFETEPLSKESPLWNMPNVFITPHVSAMSRPRDIAEQFMENYKLFQQNLPFPTKVDFEKGY